MTESTGTSVQERQALDLCAKFDELFVKDDEALSILVTLDLAYLQVLRDLEEGSGNNTVGEWDPVESAKIAFSTPIRAETFYEKLKEIVFGPPTEGIANALRKSLPNNGKDFCKKIRYCKTKDNLEEVKRNVKQILKDTAKVGTFGGVIWARFKLSSSDEDEAVPEEDLVTDADELLDTAGEAIGTVLDIGTDVLTAGLDTVVPLSLVVKVTKGSLDKLCPCCEKCQGKGVDESGKECILCEGAGSKVPFPED